MNARFYQNGKTIDYTPVAAVAAGDVVVIGNIIGIAQTDIAAGALGAVDIEGVFEFKKTASAVVTAGAAVFYDGTAETVDGTAADGKVFAGYAVKAAAAADATVFVKINVGYVVQAAATTDD